MSFCCWKIEVIIHANTLILLQLDSSIRIHSVDMLYGEKPLAFWSNLHHHQLHAMVAPKPEDPISSESQDTTEKHSHIVVSMNTALCLSFSLFTSLIMLILVSRKSKRGVLRLLSSSYWSSFRNLFLSYCILPTVLPRCSDLWTFIFSFIFPLSCLLGC